MKRQRYFPRILSERPKWFGTFAGQLLKANETLKLPADDVAAIIADARFLAYVTGSWLTGVRGFAPSATSAVKTAMEGTGLDAMTLPLFTVPALPAGVVAVPPGGYSRIKKFVQTIKASPNYTDPIGMMLGIIGSEDATEHPLPTFTLSVERGDAWERVRIDFEKYDENGVAIQSRRGDEWETIAPAALASPYLDERPLLDPARPEVREYRLQFYGDHGPVGEYTPVAAATVSP